MTSGKFRRKCHVCLACEMSSLFNLVLFKQYHTSPSAVLLNIQYGLILLLYNTSRKKKRTSCEWRSGHDVTKRSVCFRPASRDGSRRSRARFIAHVNHVKGVSGDAGAPASFSSSSDERSYSRWKVIFLQSVVRLVCWSDELGVV